MRERFVERLEHSTGIAAIGLQTGRQQVGSKLGYKLVCFFFLSFGQVENHM